MPFQTVSAPATERNMSFNYKKNRAWAENLTIVMQLGLTMVGCIAFCFYVGLKLDRWLETRGIFTAVFTVLGVVGGANVAYRQIMEIIRDKDKNTQERGPDDGNH
jgi:F0F1-type ATP synthase assembly protein I